MRIFGQSTRLNAATYLDVLDTTYGQDLYAIFGDGPYIFQQDGAPCHRSAAAQEYCQKNYRSFWGKESWPPASPDLNVLDYFVWGWLQDYVNKKEPRSRQSLIAAAREAAHALPLDLVKKAVDGWYKRVALCAQENGMQFKHRLRQGGNMPTPPPRPDGNPVEDDGAISAYEDMLLPESDGSESEE